MNKNNSWFKIFSSIHLVKKTVRASRRKSVLLLILGMSICAPAMAGWEVQWIDRFDGSGVNWDNWTAQIQANYNGEIQCYTDDDSSIDKNYDVSDGTLKIIARRQSVNCPGLGGQPREWTSGRLNSKDKREFLYGRIEARIRFLDLELGTWPAFWMLENRIGQAPIRGDNDTAFWPAAGAGEIDVWEWFAKEGGQYITNFFNNHGCGSEVRPNYSGGSSDVQDFHTYAIEWDANDIRFYMDDTVVASHDVSSCAQYKESMFVLLNVAVGGSLGGEVDPSLDVATMEVDYVAHCSATNANNLISCNESTPVIADDDGDGVSNDLDLCPATPLGTSVGTDGCELPPLDGEPTEAAPEPTASASNVISLFSDAYSNIPEINYNPFWEQATVVDQVDIAGDNTLRYTGLDYQGTEYEQNHQDVSSMTSLHVDYWTANATALSVYVISPGPVEIAYDFIVEKNTWVSTDIPISVFNSVDLTNTFQIKITGNGTVFLDNIYFVADEVIVDTDQDGVPDADDLCAATPVGATVDVDGCEVVQDVNVAPAVSLVMSQNGSSTTIIDPAGGDVTITAVISDSNSQDSHTLNWNVDALPSPNSVGSTVSFDPSSLADGNYSISISIDDNGSPVLSDEASLDFTVEAEAPPVTTPPATTTPPETTTPPATTTTPAVDSVDESGGGSGDGLLVLLLSGLFGRKLLRKR